MLFEVEFLRFTEKAPEGELLCRVVGAFADLKAVEQAALGCATSRAGRSGRRASSSERTKQSAPDTGGLLLRRTPI